MNKQDKKWMPPVGQVVRASWVNGDGDLMDAVVEALAYHGDDVWVLSCGINRVFRLSDIKFRPLKTEAEKRRDEMIEEMVRVSVNAVGDTEYSVDDCDHVYVQAITRLYDAGWKKLKPLTESTIKHIVESKIKKTYTANDLMVAKAIEAHIRGEA